MNSRTKANSPRRRHAARRSPLGAGACIFFLVLAFHAIAAAQPGQRPDRDPIGEHLFPPELIMSNQNALGLDEAQKEAIRTEVQNAQMRFTEVQWKLHDAMETLGTLLEQEPTDEQAVMDHLDQVLEAEREVKRTQLTLMIRIKNALTPGQRDRLRDLREDARFE